jgi:hypothetical protein
MLTDYRYLLVYPQRQEIESTELASTDCQLLVLLVLTLDIDL